MRSKKKTHTKRIPAAIWLIAGLYVFVSIACKSPVKNGSGAGLLIQRIDSLKKQGYPVMDLHAHLKGGLTMEQLLEHSERTGIEYGVAINCGKGFPVHSDSALSAYYHAHKHYPVYHAVQAEGREWISIVSMDTVELYDYVFTDAMTFHDAEGRRTRLWVEDEVHIGDPQAFMDYLVDQIVNIVNTEPIDIYVNATYLPKVITDRYNELWTEERIRPVIAALKENDVALEIGVRLKLPSPGIIKMAKEAGVKFTFGTNNGGPDLGYLEYGLDMIDVCGLRPEDFWVPPE